MTAGADTAAVVALAGRRIDAAGTPDARSRFPLANVARVAQRIDAELARVSAVAIVCSAACGADLVALDVAESRGMRRRIVLPFGADRFALTSVNDRPGDWMARFTRHVEAATRAGDLITLPASGDDERDYRAANEAVIAQASMLAGSLVPAARPHAFAVWDGVPRASGDATAAFMALAAQAGFAIVEIPTR